MTLEKIVFLFHYVMNFRSRFTRELKSKLNKHQITSDQHENGAEQVSDVSQILKEAKLVLD
jgi:hypothetical protein